MANSKNIRLKARSENMDAHSTGVAYFVEGVGTFYIRRGGQKGWKQALRDATDEVMGMDCNHNFISFEHEQAINSKACANYIVAKLGDDIKDFDDNNVVNSTANIRAILENPENYSLVLDLINASHEFERFLLMTLMEECEEIKKS